MMKPDKKVEEFLNRYLPSASKEEMEADGARVLQQLTLSADQQLDATSQPSVDSDSALLARAWWQFAPVRVAAAIVFLALLLGPLIKVFVFPENVFAIVETVTGSAYQVSDGKQHALTVGQRIELGTPVRTQRDANAVLKLPGGSIIEVQPESELSLERTTDGMNIRVSDGSVNVTPAKEPAGALYVQNRPVTGPITSTAAVQSPRPVVAPNPPEQLLDRFEVVSIRPRETRAPAPGQRTGAGNQCSPPSVQLDPKRLAVRGVSLYTLIGWAYSRLSFGVDTAGTTVANSSDCRMLSQFDLVVGASGWISSDLWDIEAVIPTGSAVQPESLKAQTPKLQKMLQTLLADRFSLVLRRDMKEMPVYLLKTAKDGPKFNGHPARRGATKVEDENGKLVEVDDSQINNTWRFFSISRNGALYTTFEVWNTPLDALTPDLSQFAGRPILNRSGVADPVNFHIEWPSPDFATRPQGFPIFTAAGGASMVKAVKEIGLDLEESKAPVEILVVDRAEKPSAN